MPRPPLAYLGAALSGLLLAAAFPPFNQAWLVWIALIPALLGLNLAPRPGPALSWRELGPGFLMGLLFYGGTFWWIGYVTVAGTVILILYVALYPALWLAAARRLWRREPPFGSVGNLLLGAELASGWIGLEWVRGWLFTGFGWNDLGVALWKNLPLIQGARLGGVLLLSWLVVLVNVVGALTLVRLHAEIGRRQKMRPHVDFSVALLAVAVLFAYGFHHLFAPRSGALHTLRYVLVQPDIPQDFERPFPPGESLRRHIEFTANAAPMSPALVVWPETPVGVGVLDNARYRQAVGDLVAHADFSLLMGSLDIAGTVFRNAAFLFPPHGAGDPQVYAKNRLIPFGEYAPFARQFPIMRRFVPFEIDFTPGTSPSILTMRNGGTRLAPLICYEDTLPGFARSAAKLGPDVLVNITNDGWFGRSPGAELHLANALFRAVELDRPLLRCGNTGISAAIDQTGRPTSILTLEGRSVDVPGILGGEIGWYPAEETPYLRYGDWILAFPLAALGFRLGRRLLKGKLNPAPGSS